VTPIRDATTGGTVLADTSNVLFYNPSSEEITYAPISSYLVSKASAYTLNASSITWTASSKDFGLYTSDTFTYQNTSMRMSNAYITSNINPPVYSIVITAPSTTGSYTSTYSSGGTTVYNGQTAATSTVSQISSNYTSSNIVLPYGYTSNGTIAANNSFSSRGDNASVTLYDSTNVGYRYTVMVTSDATTAPAFGNSTMTWAATIERI